MKGTFGTDMAWNPFVKSFCSKIFLCFWKVVSLLLLGRKNKTNKFFMLSRPNLRAFSAWDWTEGMLEYQPELDSLTVYCALPKTTSLWPVQRTTTWKLPDRILVTFVIVLGAAFRKVSGNSVVEVWETDFLFSEFISVDLHWGQRVSPQHLTGQIRGPYLCGHPRWFNTSFEYDDDLKVLRE